MTYCVFASVLCSRGLTSGASDDDDDDDDDDDGQVQRAPVGTTLANTTSSLSTAARCGKIGGEALVELGLIHLKT